MTSVCFHTGLWVLCCALNGCRDMHAHGAVASRDGISPWPHVWQAASRQKPWRLWWLRVALSFTQKRKRLNALYSLLGQLETVRTLYLKRALQIHVTGMYVNTWNIHML